MITLFRRAILTRIISVIAVLVLVGHLAYPQQKSDRDQSWKPNDGKYYFSQAWVWSYVDQFSGGGDDKSGITVYVDTLSGTFLFNHETYGMSDDHADFIIAFQNGVYLTGSTDENGNKMLKTDTLEAIESTHNAKQYYDESFQKITKPTGEFKIYGQNKKKWPTVTGQKFITTFDTPGAFSNDYLVKKNFSLLPIYYFNQREGAARLPYNFSPALHMNYLLLETLYESDGKKLSIILEEIIPSSKLIDLTLYQK